ncbi:MAG: Gfo/Idh/MocA family oxidoreductase [Flavobacterium sp.]|nr:MAG: Gfo/Idh/MocA family oxidoreductase [Flavobacterium sp.]
MMEKIGIIGCGAVTQNSYSKALSMYQNVKVAYVYDTNSELAEDVALMFGASSVTKEILLSESDIVIIATPPSTHHSLVKEALAKGKKVICEKPFVGTFDESVDLIDTAKKHNSKLYVAHFRRCYPSVQLARSIIKSGILGDVTSIKAYEGGHFSWQTKSGYVFKDPFGGVLFDTGSHTVDMALHIANLDGSNFETKISKVGRDRTEPAHEIDAEMKLIKEDKSEIDFTLKLSRRSVLANKIRVNCTNGYIDVPVLMSNYIRLGGKNSSTVIYSNIKYNTLTDCFAMQFKGMFDDTENSIFEASLFCGLTKILENIAKN